MSTQAFHDSSFLKEVWGLYGVGMAIIATRFVVRTRAVGVRGWQGDDWMAIVVLACYTCDAATVQLCYKLGTNLDWSQAQLQAFNQDDQDKIEFGSKMQLLAWYVHSTTIRDPR